MKLIIALAAAGIVSSLTVITPANAQKDPACMEKCNRDNRVEGGGRQARGTGQLIKERAFQPARLLIQRSPED